MNKSGYQVQQWTDVAVAMLSYVAPWCFKLLHGARALDRAMQWRAMRGNRGGVLILRTVGNDREPLSDLPAMTADDIHQWRAFRTLKGDGYYIILEVRINERFTTNIDDWLALCDATLIAAHTIVDAGFIPGVLITSEGNPPGLRPEDTFGMDFWLHPRCLAVLRELRKLGAVWGPHGYSHPPAASDEAWHSTRPRYILANLPEDCRLNYYYGESGCDGGTSQADQKPGQGFRAYFPDGRTKSPALQYGEWMMDKRANVASDPLCIGEALFLSGADPASRPPWDTFDIRDEVDMRAYFTGSVEGPPITWLTAYNAIPTPSTPTPPLPPPRLAPSIPLFPTRPGGGQSVDSWCPFANKTPLTRNFDDGGQAPKIIVDHITDGLGDPYQWWNRVVAESEGASADFWISRKGELNQYVLLRDTSWSNGPLRDPDLRVPFLAWLVRYKQDHPEVTGNFWTVSIEHEGKPGEALTPPQIAMSCKLHLWLSVEYAIPLDRQHVLGHYQFDSITRSRCPGSAFPWAAVMGAIASPAPWDRDAYEANAWAPINTGLQWLAARGGEDLDDARAIAAMLDTQKGRRLS